MNRNILSFIIGLPFFLLYGCISPEKPVASWSFEENSQNETLESVHNGFTQVQTVRKNLELVSGIAGNGLRTDGYSTFMNAHFGEEITAPISVEGWFALETYPTDTAAFFSIGKDSANYISACVNQFGRPMISVCKQGDLSWFAASNPVKKFEWMNVALSISENEVLLFLNGKIIASAGLSESLSFSGFLLGRDTREKRVHIFPITYINGIIDEVKVWDKAFVENDFQREEINELSQITPKLAIPQIRFEGDFHRPKYHLLPAANWTNETHGLIYHKGKYHIFNQKNGTNVYLGRINWGHFSSPDLVHWTEHKPALTPEEGYDQYGIWSGHAVIDDKGKPVIVYTGGDGTGFGICLAYPQEDELINWRKFDNNPVIKGPPNHFSRIDFRDPYLWKEGETWYMIVGFGLVEKSVEKGTVLLYKSPDLKNWVYLHPLFKGNPLVDDTGIFWEMPVFWKIDGKYILLVNPTPHHGKPAVAIYWTGDFVGEKFVPDHQMPKRLEIINRMLSPSVNHDENGLTTAIAIIPDLIPAEMQMTQGWTHLFSIPRIWELVNGYIYQNPHPALQKLRNNETSFSQQAIEPGQNLSISKGKHQLEIIARINPGNAKKLGFVIGKNSSNGEETKIYFDLEMDEMVIDLTNSSKNNWVRKNIEKGAYNLDSTKEVEIHLFVDGSVVEGFINGKDAFTTRIFPEFENSDEIELFTEGGSSKLMELKFWELKASNNKTDF